MSDQSSVLPAAKPKSRWRWLKIMVGICAALFLAFNLLGIANTPKLEIRRTSYINRFATDTIQILNVGDKPIMITKVVINDRPECLSGAFEFRSRSLKIGDVAQISAACSVVIRAAIETDQGSATYSFASK